jgi:hypothetical protein
VTDQSAFIYRLVTGTLSAVIICVVVALLIGLFNPKVDNDKIFPIISHAFDTIVGVFCGILGGRALEKKTP